MALPKILSEPLPFGVLKTAHWVLPLLNIIFAYAQCSPVRLFFPSSYGYVDGVSWFAFVVCLASWIALVCGAAQKTLKISDRYVLVPYLVVDCCLAALFAWLYAIATIVCLSVVAGTFPPNCYDLPEELQPQCLPGMKWSKGAARALVGINVIASLLTTASYAVFAMFVVLGLPRRGLSELATSFIDGRKIVTITGIDQETGEIQAEALGDYETIG